MKDLEIIYEAWRNSREYADCVSAQIAFLNWVKAERRVWAFNGNIRDDVPMAAIILAYETGLEFCYNQSRTKVWL